MFEKESQDYAMKEVALRQELYIKGRADIDTDYEKVKKIWQDGAEFGYNKANEWHKVADGDIPENERWVCNQDGCYCYYDIDTEQWLDTEGTRTRTIEWCDMPTKESE